MDQQDLQQISDLMDQKFEENNKILKKEIVKDVNDKIEEAMLINKEEFERVGKRFDEVDEELKKKATAQQVLSWGDNKVVALEIDMDKVKYIHRDEWDKLPPTIEIRKALAEKGLKKKQ